MFRNRSLVALLGILFAIPICGHAEGFDIGIGFGRADAGGRSSGNIGVTDPQQGPINVPVNLGSGFAVVPRMTLNTGKWISHDISFTFTRMNVNVPSPSGELFDGTSNVGHYMYNMLFNATPDDAKFRPYAAAGGGLVSYFPPGAGLFSGVNTVRPALNYGAGLRVQVNELVHIRADFRQTVAPNPELFQGQDGSGAFRQNIITFGGGITF